MQGFMTPPTTPTGSVAQVPQWAPERCNAKRIDTSTAKVQHDRQQTTQTQWQSTSHLPERRMMVQRILQLSQSQSQTKSNPQRAVLLAKRIELALYSRAGSLTEYCNLATLRRRLQSLVASSVHEAAASETVTGSLKRRVVARDLMHVTKRRRRVHPPTSCSIFSSIGEDCTRLVFSFLDGNEVMRHRTLNRFAATFLPRCVLSLTVEVAQLTQGLASQSSMLQMTNLQTLVVHKAGALSLSPAPAPRVGSASTPLYAWGCTELPTAQSNDGETAVLALSGALTSGTFPSLKKLQLISVFVNTMSRNALRSLCNALESGCPLLEDLLLAGNSLADLGAFEVARLLQSAQAPRLTRLDLRRNFIGETGLRAVLSALAQCTTPSLQVLCMGGNLVTDNCVVELQSLLAGAVCPSLRFLGLEDNFLSSEGVQFVLETAAVTSTRARRVSCDRDVSMLA